MQYPPKYVRFSLCMVGVGVTHTAPQRRRRSHLAHSIGALPDEMNLRLMASVITHCVRQYFTAVQINICLLSVLWRQIATPIRKIKSVRRRSEAERRTAGRQDDVDDFVTQDSPKFHNVQ